MFKEWKFGTAFALELMLPWLVMASGWPAIYYFFEAGRIYREQYDCAEYQLANEIFHNCYDMAMVTGAVVAVLEALLGITALILLISALVQKSKAEYSVCRPLILWLCGAPCAVGALLLMLFVNTFTYGMGI